MERSAPLLALVVVSSLLCIPPAHGGIVWEPPQDAGSGAPSMIAELAIEPSGQQHILYISDHQYMYGTRRLSSQPWETMDLAPLYENNAIPADLLVVPGQAGEEASIGAAMVTDRQGHPSILYCHVSDPGWCSTLRPREGSLSDLSLMRGPAGRERVCYTSSTHAGKQDLLCASFDGQDWHTRLVDDGFTEMARAGSNLTALTNPVTNESVLLYYGAFKFGDPTHPSGKRSGYPLFYTKPDSSVGPWLVEAHLLDCTPPAFCVGFLPAIILSAVVDEAGRVHFLFHDPRTGTFRLASQTSATSYTFQRGDVDPENAQGAGGGAWPSSASLAIGSDGVLRAAIVNARGVDRGIRYGERIDGVWRFEPVPVPMEPHTLHGYLSLALDAENNPHITYTAIDLFEVTTSLGYIRGWRREGEEASCGDGVPQPRGTPLEKLSEEIDRFTKTFGIRTGTP